MESIVWKDKNRIQLLDPLWLCNFLEFCPKCLFFNANRSLFDRDMFPQALFFVLFTKLVPLLMVLCISNRSRFVYSMQLTRKCFMPISQNFKSTHNFMRPLFGLSPLLLFYFRLFPCKSIFPIRILILPSNFRTALTLRHKNMFGENGKGINTKNSPT